MEHKIRESGGMIMREIIEEYAGVAAGGVAAMAILTMAVQFVLGGSGLYGVILGFSQSIC